MLSPQFSQLEKYHYAGDNKRQRVGNRRGGNYSP
jgi:hypothetical protein